MLKVEIQKYKNIHIENIDSIRDGLQKTISDFSVNSEITKIRKSIEEYFFSIGFTKKIKLNSRLNLSITGGKQDCGLCVQLGNIARYYADLVKLNYMYKQNIINKSIYICFSKSFEKKCSSGNLATMERISKELEVMKGADLPILFLTIEDYD